MKMLLTAGMPSEGQSHIALDVQPEEQCVSSQADGQPGAPAGSASSHPEYNVALRIEELSSGHLKGIMFVEYLGGALGLAAAILARIYVQNEVGPCPLPLNSLPLYMYTRQAHRVHLKNTYFAVAQWITMVLPCHLSTNSIYTY